MPSNGCQWWMVGLVDGQVVFVSKTRTPRSMCGGEHRRRRRQTVRTRDMHVTVLAV